jgi:CubicO group peptidase (beta-lactamase class C family)
MIFVINITMAWILFLLFLLPKSKRYMRKLLTAILLLIITTGIYGQKIGRLDDTVITADSLRHRIEYLMHTAGVTGLCITVINNNKPVYSQAFGYADGPDKLPLKTSTVFYSASFSKAVFGYLVMEMVQEHKINLDTPLVRYLPKPLVDYPVYQDLRGDERRKKITARMCLDHSSGLPNSRNYDPDKKLRIAFDPGTNHCYSGEGMRLLQFVIEQITGKGLEDLAQERIFKPLGMINTSYVWQERFTGNTCLGHNAAGQPYPYEKCTEASAAGSMLTTLNDYTKFMVAAMKHKGLRAASFDELIRPQIKIRSKQQFGPNAQVVTTENDKIQLSYALGFGAFTTPYGRAFFKDGHDEGWGHYSVGFPDADIAIIIMCNSDRGESIFKDILATAIADTYTPWYWLNYIPYNQK